MSETIQISQKPKKTMLFYDGEIFLDQTYSFELVKTVNGSEKHMVQNIQYEEAPENGSRTTVVQSVVESDPRYSLIVGAIINWAEKNGIGT